MADYDSSLPIRTETAGDVDVFVSDATTPSQKLKVNVDGSINTDLVTGAKVIVTDGTDNLAVNGDGSVNAVVTATDLDVRDLAFATDKVDVTGSSVTVSATDLDIRDLSASTDSVKVHLNDESGNPYSPTNPLSVVQVSDQAGDEICEYNESVAVAKNASVNHDYTVTAAKTFLGEMIWVSGSGKLRAEILVNGVTKFVGFSSTANPNIEIPLHKIMKGLTTEVVRITLTNLDQEQDLYSTLLGLEV